MSLIVEIGAGIPQATQELAQEAWDLAVEPAGAGAATVRHALDRVVGHEQGRFIAVWDDLSSPQRRVLRAIALGGGGAVFSESCLATWGLGVASRVQASLRALLEKGLVEQAERGMYRLTDPFLPAWLATA